MCATKHNDTLSQIPPGSKQSDENININAQIFTKQELRMKTVKIIRNKVKVFFNVLCSYETKPMGK